MFVVYSPEGRSFIGAAQNLPVLRVDPVKRVSPAQEAGMENRRMEPDHSDAHFQQDSALRRYQRVQNADQEQRHPAVSVAEIMSISVVTVSPETTLETVWNLMQQHQIHHLPVMSDDQLVGMCSRNDVLKRVIVDDKGELEQVSDTNVAKIMRSEVVTAHPHTEIRQVALALTQYAIGALPIIDQQERLVGIVTLSDLVKRLSQLPPIELYV
jgi:acetoin utilization protein AcuB